MHSFTCFTGREMWQIVLLWHSGETTVFSRLCLRSQFHVVASALFPVRAPALSIRIVADIGRVSMKVMRLCITDGLEI